MILNNAKDIRLGTNAVDRVYQGNNLVYERNPYTKDGLIMWLDGINNTRNGFNAESLVWEDLVGNNDWRFHASSSLPQVPLWDGKSWESLYNSPNNAYQLFINDTLNFASSTKNAFTIELCMERYIGGGTYNTAFTCSNDAISVFRSGGNDGNIEFKFASPRPFFYGTYDRKSMYAGIDRTERVAFLWTPTRESYQLRVDGISSAGAPFYIGGGDSAHGFYGKIYGVRIYNRMLTREEMQHDWNADIERYNLSY